MIAQTKLLRAIEEQLDELVKRAENCVTNTNAAQTDLEESQLRNLQNLASATESVAVLENFIAYQIGRKKIPLDVGKQIMDNLRQISLLAEEISRQKGVDEQALRLLRIEMIRMYLGFLVRKFVAERKREERT